MTATTDTLDRVVAAQQACHEALQHGDAEAIRSAGEAYAHAVHAVDWQATVGELSAQQRARLISEHERLQRAAERQAREGRQQHAATRAYRRTGLE